MRTVMLGAAMAVVLTAGEASAATVAYTWTGTVENGLDAAGRFGSFVLDGEAFELTFTLDTTKGVRQSTTTADEIVASSASGDLDGVLMADLSINGFTQRVRGNALARALTSSAPPGVQAEVTDAFYDDEGRPIGRSVISAAYFAPTGTPVPSRLDASYATTDLYPAEPSQSGVMAGFFSFAYNLGVPTVDTYGELVFDSLTVEVAPVPLPATGTLLAFSLIGLTGVRRTRR